MQSGVVDVATIYDARMTQGMYNAFFDAVDSHPTQAYYAFAAFNKLYKIGTEVEATSDTEGLYVVAAAEGGHGAAIISNVSGKPLPLEIEGIDLEVAELSVIDTHRLLSWCPGMKKIPNDTVLLVEW